MAFTDQYALGQDATFKQRIVVAILKAAAAVQAEDPNVLDIAAQKGFPGAKDGLHRLRAALASRVLNDPTTYAARFAAVVAADPMTAGISDQSRDDDLLFTVNALWNAFALGG